MLFDLHAVDGGDGLEDLLEFFEGIDAHGFLEPGEDFGLLGGGWEVLWCLRWGVLEGGQLEEGWVPHHCDCWWVEVEGLRVGKVVRRE